MQCFFLYPWHFSLTACGTKSEPAADTTAAEAEVTETEVEAETAEEAANDEEEKVKVGVSWNADEIDEDAQLYIDAVTKAGGEAIYLPQIKTEDDAEKCSGRNRCSGYDRRRRY